MASFMNTYFGPLGEEYCVYFYALSIFFGIMFVLSLLSVLSYMFMNFKKLNMMFVANTFFLLLNSFLAYLSNRLLHTMCIFHLFPPFKKFCCAKSQTISLVVKRQTYKNNTDYYSSSVLF